MAVMGLRLAGKSNGVAKPPRRTSREMFQRAVAPCPPRRSPIGSITNGVHGRTWVSLADGRPLLQVRVARRGTRPAPRSGPASTTPATTSCGGPASRAARPWSSFVRDRLRQVAARQGRVADSDAGWTDDVLDPRCLIVGFARRFAAYKRATLLLSQPERLRALLLDSRPAGPARLRR